MKLLQRLSLFMLMLLMTACGGGDSGLSVDGNSPTDNTAKTITLTLSSNSTSAAEPVTVFATVLQGKKPVANEVVTFSTSIGVLLPTSGTALTDVNGVASVTLTAGTVRGAGDVTASIGNGAEAKIGFATQGDDIDLNDISVSIKLYDANGVETDSITSTKPGTLVATVVGVNVKSLVTFTSDVGDIPIPTAVTNENNQATVEIKAGSTLGAGVVTATLNTGETGQLLVVIGATNVRMGSGEPFNVGVADVSLPQISAGGTTVVSVKIIDDEGNLFTETVDVKFSSGCTVLATPTASLSSPITTSNGIASSTYLAKGCVGNDPINVSANAGGKTLSSQATVNVLPADVGSIEFISATPSNIGIIGTGALGGSESSTVVFKVLDTNGNPVNSQLVNFSLNTNVGGINIIPTSGTTDINGLVQTVINSGSVATTVRVKAAIDGSNPEIASQSSLLVISTGIPDQDSFSLSANIINAEGWDHDGTEVSVTARLADAFNNPVPDGTAVNFTTEGGSIEPSCTTVNGSCSVIWRSQFPRPEGNLLTRQVCGKNDDNNSTIQCAETINTLGQKFGGRATVLATAIGEESFPDLNGNGRFDASEVTAFKGNDVSGQPYDKKEAFVDYNEDGFFNPSESGGDKNSGLLEEPVDFNSNGVFDQNDGKYNGVLCSIPAHAGCSTTQKSINVRRSIGIIMSGSSPFLKVESTVDGVASTIHVDDDNNAATPINDDAGTGAQIGDGNLDTPIANPNLNPNDNTIYLAGESSGSATITLADLHNQPMPAGTRVTFSTTAGSIIGPSTYTWPNDGHNGGLSFSVFIKGEKDPTSGSVIVTVETPLGVATSFAPIGIIIQ